MYRICKKFKFEAAHRLTSAEAQECVSCIHGHSYTVEVFLRSDELNPDAMVLDFKRLTQVLEPVIKKLDHALLLPSGQAIQQRQFNKKVVVMDPSPTAEVIAAQIYRDVCSALWDLTDSVWVQKVRVHETEDSWVEYGG